MGYAAMASGWIRIRNDEELAKKLRDHIMGRLSAGYLGEERKGGYRTIRFSAPIYPDRLLYNKEDYLALYELAGSCCLGGETRFTDGDVSWACRYDKDTGLWMEAEDGEGYAGS